MAKTQTPLDTQHALAVHEPSALPDFLQGQAPVGLDVVKNTVTLGRVKVLQAQTDPDLVRQFGVGSVIIRPDNVLVAKFEQPFVVIPLFRWDSWAKWSDANDKTQGAGLLAETFNANDEVAIKARNMATRVEPYPNDPRMFFKYRANINFAVKIDGGEASGIIAALTFSGGGYNVGVRLNNYLARRNVHIYANRIELQAGQRVNASKQTWTQLDFGTPSQPFIGKDRVHAMHEAHQSIAEAFAAKTVSVATQSGEAASE